MDSNNKIQLESLRRPTDSSRPTIPYSQFPRPTLSHLATIFDKPSRSRRADESSLETCNVTSSSGVYPPDNVDLGTPSTHRRRRSSLMNGLDWTAGSVQTPSRRTEGITEHMEEPAADGRPLPANGDLELDSMSDSDSISDDEETGLNEQDRRLRKKERKKNTQMDQRVARGSAVTVKEKNDANHSVLMRMLINVMLISLWYLFSLLLSVYNAWMFGENHLDFPFPLFTTSMHMVVQFSLASLALYLMPQFRPRRYSSTNLESPLRDNVDRSWNESEGKGPIMTKWFYASRLGPCGMATGLDIGLGNMSLKFISLSFYTMCKSSSLAFVLLFAFFFRLESPSWKLVGIIGTMIVGVTTMVFGEIKFELIGFILVITAAFFSGFRWGLTQILLLRNPATSNPLSSIFFLAPVMFLTLVLLAIPIEGLPSLLSGIRGLVETNGFMAPIIILVPGVIAFLMTLSEFALLQRTSVVTLSIAGIFKEVLTISAGGLIFDDRLTPINISGLVITLCAIAAYNYIKISKMRQDAIQKVHAAATGHSENDLDANYHEGGSDAQAQALYDNRDIVSTSNNATLSRTSPSVTKLAEGKG